MAQAQVTSTMAQAQVDNTTASDVADKFHETINENATWMQKSCGKGVKFVTLPAGDWNTKCLGFCIKYNEIVVALSIEDVLNSDMFTETFIPTTKQPGARVYASKSLNLDFYNEKNMEDAEKFLQSFNNETVTPPVLSPIDPLEEATSKGAVVRAIRAKKAKMDSGDVQNQQAIPSHVRQSVHPTPDYSELVLRNVVKPKKRGRKPKNKCSSPAVNSDPPVVLSQEQLDVSDQFPTIDLDSVTKMCGIFEE